MLFYDIQVKMNLSQNHPKKAVLHSFVHRELSLIVAFPPECPSPATNSSANGQIWQLLQLIGPVRRTVARF